MTRHAFPLLGLAWVYAVAMSGPARADFFDDARRTFTADIPHFFQDDIPCTFGGRPTSGTRTACKGEKRPSRPAEAPRPVRPAENPARR